MNTIFVQANCPNTSPHPYPRVGNASRWQVVSRLGVLLLLLGTLPGVAQTTPGSTATASSSPVTAAPAGPEPFSHADWDQVLQRYVDAEGMVDYVGLAEDRAGLDRYLASLAAMSPASHPNRFPTRQEALAYYLNAYNAYVFHGVLEGGGDQESVWATMLQGYKFFIGKKIVVGGEKTHLKKLEDEAVREQFEDPRIHAALVCAAVSCPRLPQRAFFGETLDTDLDRVMREWVEDPRHARYDAESGVVYLSKIFDWYGDDFLDYERKQGQDKPELVDYVNRFRAPDQALPRDAKVRYIDYDKSLNKQ